MWNTVCYLCQCDINIEKNEIPICDSCYDSIDSEDEKLKNANLENHFTKFNP